MLAPIVQIAEEPTPSKLDKLTDLANQAEKSEDDELYKTRTTVAMTRAIALDYLKTAFPRVVGPSEIKKNSHKVLKVIISFGTLKRAMESLIEAGEVEQIEPSRWRYKSLKKTATS